MKSGQVYYQSKPRYEILDALRGVAAFIVLFYHHFEAFGPGIRSFHGYLAVDFFFILSGFVIGYSYDDRWKSASNPNGMTFGQFVKRRLTRLHPMYVMGTVIGMLFLMFGMGDLIPGIRDAHWQEILICLCITLVMLPVPARFDVRGTGEMNPFNGNTWTLTFEYIANLLYALVIRRFNKKLLAVFVGLTALLTIGVGLGWNLFGIMEARPEYQLNTFIGGWSFEKLQFVLGFCRLLYPFFAGLLLARCIVGKKSSPFMEKYGFLLSALILIAVLVVPYINSESMPRLNGIYEIICILVVFPLVVAIGAQGKVSGKAKKFCKWLGDISYPLYITHSAIIFTLCYGWKANNPGATQDQILFVCFCSIVLSVGIAWASFKLYDEPVRNWLKEHWLTKNKSSKKSSAKLPS